MSATEVIVEGGWSPGARLFLLAAIAVVTVCTVICTMMALRQDKQVEQYDEDDYNPRQKIRDLTVETFMQMADRARRQ